MKVALASLLLIAVHASVCPALAAQASAGPGQAERVAKARARLAEIGAGCSGRVEVRLTDGRKLKGCVDELRDDRAILIDSKSGERIEVPLAEIEKVRGRGLSTAAKIAITAGVAVGATLATIAILFTALGD